MNDLLNIEASANKLYNLCFIENICRNNPEKIKQMLQTFINSIPAAVEQIKNAYQRNEFTIIRQTAHTIKPVLSFYAIVALEEDINLIEQLAKEETNTADLNRRILKLDEVINSIVADMTINFLNK